MVHLVVKMSCGGDITAPSDHTAGCCAARMGNVWLIVHRRTAGAISSRSSAEPGV